MKAFSITDTGKTRSINQDYIYKEESIIGNLPNLFLVADGMGGHNAGDYASRCCVEAFVDKVNNSETRTPIGIMNEAIQEANKKIIEDAEKNHELHGMGTTVVSATIVNKEMYVANVGDSRLYIIHKNEIKQITQDHSVVEEMVRKGHINKKEARVHPNKNIITRALGAGNRIVPDFFEINIETIDYILMCTDGLTNMIDDEEIKSIILKHGTDVEEAGKELVEKANLYGGKDNISVILIIL